MVHAVRGGPLCPVGGLVAGVDDLRQRLAVVLHVALGRFNKVGNQVVATLKLHVDLSPGVVQPVFQSDKAVVQADDVNDDGGNDGQSDPGVHGGSFRFRLSVGNRRQLKGHLVLAASIVAVCADSGGGEKAWNPESVRAGEA